MRISLLNMHGFGVEGMGYTIPILQAALAGLHERKGGGAPWCYGTFGDLQKDESPAVLNLSDLSHRFTNLRIEDDDLVGELEILDKFPKGAILKEIMAMDSKLVAFSMRGVHIRDFEHRLTEFVLVSVAAVAVR